MTLLRLFSRIAATGALCLALTAPTQASDDWQQIIRNLPYQYSLGMADNLATIRQWVLLSQGYCETPARHVLFDQRGLFLGWMDNLETSAQTQQKLNQRRQLLVQQGKAHRWLAGDEHTPGYPFAFSCDQPHVDVDAALGRMFGRTNEDRLWGTWDGMVAGTEQAPITLAEVVELVYRQRQSGLQEGGIAIPLPLLLAQLLVESGGQKQAHSQQNAVGILQLTPQALSDCELAERFHRHRMAQVDCAVRLYVINQRNLQAAFDERFGHLPEAKKSELFGLLLMQSYHSGIGAMQKLLLDEEQGKAAQHFAEHSENYSAADIVTGMLYHNLGRQPWGWASLFYVLDIQLVVEKLCQQPEARSSGLCRL